MIYFGIALSSFGYLATIVSFCMFRAFNHGLIQKLLVAKSITLLLSNLLFIVITFVTVETNEKACKSLATLLHYFILVSFFWMLILSIAQYMKFIRVVNSFYNHFFVKSAFFALGKKLIHFFLIKRD